MTRVRRAAGDESIASTADDVAAADPNASEN
jgi:hypothetical protein